MSVDEAAQMPRPVTASAAAAAGWRLTLLVVVVLAAAGLKGLLNSLMGPILPMMAAYFGSASAAQFITTAAALGVAVGGPVSGWLLLRLGTRSLTLWGVALYGLSGAAGLVVDQVPVLLGTRFVLGFVSVWVSTCAATLIAERWTGDARARMLGYFSSVGSAAGVATLLLAGAVAEVAGWRAPFAIYLLVAVFVLLAALPSVPATRPVEAVTVEDKRGLWGLWGVFTWVMVAFVGIYTTSLQLPFLLYQDGVTSPATISGVISAFALSMAAAAAAYGWIKPHIGMLAAWVAALALVGAGTVTVGLGQGLVPAAAGSVLIGLGGGISIAHFYDVVALRSPATVRGAAFGILSTANYLGQFVNPVILGPVQQGAGVHVLFVLVGGFFLLAALWHMVARRTL